MNVIVIAALLVTAAVADSAMESPAPFGKYLVYSAAGVYDPAIPPVEGDLAEWFHYEIMGRDEAAFLAEQDAADEFFSVTFGAQYTPGSLTAFGLDPRNEYRAYFISGEKVPPEGWVVRDGGFRAVLNDGGIVVYGDYNIETLGPGKSGAREPIIIHYESAHAIYPMPDGSLLFLNRLNLIEW